MDTGTKVGITIAGTALLGFGVYWFFIRETGRVIEGASQSGGGGGGGVFSGPSVGPATGTPVQISAPTSSTPGKTVVGGVAISAPVPKPKTAIVTQPVLPAGPRTAGGRAADGTAQWMAGNGVPYGGHTWR